MFEKRLRELSEKFGTKKKEKFYILTHKKHRREVYFKNNREAKEFLKNKLHSDLGKYWRLKRFIYFLIKIGLLQPFLKKTKLSYKFGDVIYVADQIKDFDLKNKLVYSYPRSEKQKKDFIDKKEISKGLSKKGFCPEIKKLDKKIPYSKQKLLKKYNGGRDVEVFKKIMKLYREQGIKEISLKEYVGEIMSENKIKNKNLRKNLADLYNLDKTIIITKLHGDFAKENVLIDENNKIFFIDWDPKEGPITESLFNFFKDKENPLENKEFMKILKRAFSREIQRDIKLYLKLHEITSNIKK